MNLARSCFKFVEYGGKLYGFSSTGVDVYRLSDWTLIATASMSITCGAVNDNGIWLGPADDGVWRLPHGYTGDITSRATKRLSTTSATILPSDVINDIDGKGTALVIAYDVGVSYLPDVSTVYSVSTPGGVDLCAIGATKISYEISGDVYVMDTPTSNWLEDDAEPIGSAITDDDFTGDDDDPPNSGLWATTNPANGTATIQSNKLHLEFSSSASEESILLDSLWRISGDFEVIVEFSNLSLSVAAINGLTLKVTSMDDIDDNAYVGARYSTSTNDCFRSQVKQDGVGFEENASRTYSYGALKISRSGSTVSTFYKDGEGVWTAGDSDVCSSAAMMVSLYHFAGASTGVSSGDFDNFAVVSGTITAPSAVNDDFDGVDGDPPSESLWAVTNSTHGIFSIQSNKLNASFSSGMSAAEYPYVDSIFSLSGDFELEVEFSDLSGMNTTNDSLRLYVLNPDLTDRAGVFAGNFGASEFRLFTETDGSGVTFDTSRTNSFGKMKVVRSGSTITPYYMDGNGSYVAGPNAATSSDEMKVRLLAFNASLTTSVGGNFDNFTLISGTPVDVPGSVGTCRRLRFASEDYLFVAHDAGIGVFDGATPKKSFGSSLLGSVIDVIGLAPGYAATNTAGFLAYGTSDSANGGQFGVLDLAAPVANLVTESGDFAGVWVANDAAAGAYDGTLEIYAWTQEISPAPKATGVRRDWSLYAEIVDTLDGIAVGTVALKINGATVTPTLTAITDGYRVEYTPAASSGYLSRTTVELSAEDSNGNTVSRSWYFTTTAPPAATVTDAPPPNVVCIRDIGLTATEADETVESVPVIWLDDITGPLIITEDQAEAVGKAALDETTYHRHLRTIQIEEEDLAGADPQDLQQGNIITLTCPAIGMTAKKCEILAVQRKVAKGQPTLWNLKVACYEAIT